MFEVGVAISEYHDLHAHLPPGDEKAYRDANGQPFLSWRVHLLPHIGQRKLYEEFHLDEPWDSPHNKALLPRMPGDFALAEDLAEGMTDIIAPSGPMAVFGQTKPLSLENIKDGEENTVLCVEAAPDHVVPWTRPDDFVFDPNAKNAMSRFGQPNDDFFVMLMANGLPRYHNKGESSEFIMQLIDFADGRPLGFGFR
jgi:hypothetical protein